MRNGSLKTKDMEITKELLEAKQQELAKVWHPIEVAHKQKKEEVFKPLLDMLDTYYDSKLFDSNGMIVKVADIIVKGRKKYAVTSRNMQFVFGSFLMNPTVFAKPLLETCEINIHKKEIAISVSELKHYTVLESLSNEAI